LFALEDDTKHAIGGDVFYSEQDQWTDIRH